jgi:hypothetical protein
MSAFFNDFKILVICLTIIFICGIAATSLHHKHESVLKSQNIDSAIAKGIDPLSVRCSYTNSQDMLCITYALSLKK